MPAQLEEIEGKFIGETFRWSQTLVGVFATLDDKIVAIKGEADEDELRKRHSYRLYGRWAKYTNKRTGQVEQQFHFSTFVAAVAHDRDGVIAYLERAGKGHGLGKVTAVKAWERWGSDAVRTIRNDPGQLRSIGNISEANAAAIGFELRANEKLEDCTIELTALLNGRGFPKATPRAVIKEYGNTAADRIKRDPFTLLRFRGCGFKRCDQLWLELGLDAKSIRRQCYAAWYAVASNSDGHTWFMAESILRSSQSSVRAIRMLARLARMFPTHPIGLATMRTESIGGPIVDDGSLLWLAENCKATKEQQLAENVHEALGEFRPSLPDVSLWPDAADIENISDHQRVEIAKALIARITMLCGSPGTGKTHLLARLIAAVIKLGIVSIGDIAVGAPTGKAAVRITEALHAAGLSITARTWHSLLGIGATGDGWKYHAGNEWPFKVIFGDESSMLDTSLASAIFAAQPRGCHVLLVGDTNQLPPVGHGAPMRDLIAAHVPRGELTEIVRSSGGIVEACAAIRDGKQWGEGDNLEILRSADADHQIGAMLARINQAGQDGFDPVWDCQVLCAVNAASELSRKKLNRILQQHLNTNEPNARSPFRLHDKIVCLQNGNYTAIDTDDDATDENGQVRVANGELAKVIELADNYLIADLEMPRRTIRIPLGKSEAGEGNEVPTGCAWDLAYALSVHKSQGSEWPVAIIMLDDYPGARRICDRSWLYTAISRAKKQCVLIGRKSTANAMAKRQAIANRKTFLRERIKLQSVQRVLELI